MVTVAQLKAQFLGSKKPSTPSSTALSQAHRELTSTGKVSASTVSQIKSSAPSSSQAISSALSQAHRELASTGKVSSATVNKITLARSSETGKSLVPAISPLSPQKTTQLEQAEEPLPPQQFRERVASDLVNTTGNITPLQVQEFASSQQIPITQAEQFLRTQFPDRFEAVPPVEIVQMPLPAEVVQDSLHEAITNTPAPQVLLPPETQKLPETSVKEPLFGEDLLPLFSPVNADGSINWIAILIYAGIILLLLGVFS